MTARPLQVLMTTDDPAWPELHEKLSTADVPVDVPPVESTRAHEALFRLQVTTRSVLGALVSNTGGLVIDHGWLRILGGGHAGLPDVATIHFGSETLTWQPIGGRHSAFIGWVLSGGLDGFYADPRWDGWASAVEELAPDRGLSVHPPLWSTEGRADIAATSRRSCPPLELTTLHLDTAARLDNAGCDSSRP